MASQGRRIIPRGAGLKVSGVILAGGKSSRIGRDKAFLRIDGQTLIERTFAELSAVFPEIIIVSNRPRAFKAVGEGLWTRPNDRGRERSPAPTFAVVSDIIKDVGPLGGIHAGLRTMANEYGFFVACDMPFVRANAILDQVEFLKHEICDAVVPRWNGHVVEPLHAIYGRRCLPAIETCLEAGHRKIVAFYDDVRLRYWDLNPAETWSRYFHNINTKNELLRTVNWGKG